MYVKILCTYVEIFAKYHKYCSVATTLIEFGISTVSRLHFNTAFVFNDRVRSSANSVVQIAVSM